MLHVGVKQNGARVNYYFTRFDVIFSRMLENVIAESLGEVNLSEMSQIAFKMSVPMSSFLIFFLFFIFALIAPKLNFFSPKVR